jgi:CspA family cold shock protein
MSPDQPIETSPLVTPTPISQLTGRVKWFNNKAGYGFITGIDGTNAGSDIFVHHSRIVVNNEQYKYLVQGEYVGFTLEHTPGQAHEYQAESVSGVNGGNLMCETRREFRQNRVDYSKSMSSDAEPVTPRAPRITPRSTRPPPVMERHPSVHSTPRGSGPRDGAEWTLVTGRGQGRGRGRGQQGRGQQGRGQAQGQRNSESQN